MSGCERGRRTRCERGTESHPTNKATTTPTSTSSTNQHQQNHQHQHEDHHHQHAPPGPPPAPWTMANSTGTNNTSTVTTQHNHQHQHKDQQPAPASLAAVPPPAPAPHAGICSVHVSMYAQDSKIYSYILQNKCWHAGSCIYTCLKCFPLFDTQHTNKHASTSKLRECQH